jgi:hypothetical protein
MPTRKCIFLTALFLVLWMTGCSAPVEQVATPASTFPVLEMLAPGETPAPALLEKRLIELEWPHRIREKDSDLIVLSILMDDQGELTVSGGTPIDIPNIYETHNIVAVARLDMAGLEAYRDELREPLRPGRAVAFRWSVRANDAGRYRGVVWLHLELIPRAGGPVERILLMARTIEIEAVTVFGMSGSAARVLGIAGVLLSTVLGFPFIQRQFETWWKRRRGRDAAATSPVEEAGATATEKKEVHPPE